MQNSLVEKLKSALRGSNISDRELQLEADSMGKDMGQIYRNSLPEHPLMSQPEIPMATTKQVDPYAEFQSDPYAEFSDEPVAEVSKATVDLNDPRIPSGIHPETMKNAPISEVGNVIKGVVGLPKDLSSLSQPPLPLKDQLLQILNPMNSVGGSTLRQAAETPGNLTSGEPYRIGQGINSLLTAVPVAKGAALTGRTVGRKIVEPIRADMGIEDLRHRITQSWLNVDKHSNDFGRDPVGEVANLPAANSRRAAQENIRTAAAEREVGIMNAVKEHTDLAAQEGLPTGIAVEGRLRGAANKALAKIKRDHPGEAASAEAAINNLIEDMKRKYNSSDLYLEPVDLWGAKRALGEEIAKFKEGPQANIHLQTIKQDMYSVLDRAFDDLIPSAAPLNKSWSGLIEAEHLLDDQIRKQKNSPLLAKKGGLFESVASKFPDVSIKSHLNSALRGPVRPVEVPSTMTFQPRQPVMDPYSPGYRMSDHIKKLMDEGR